MMRTTRRFFTHLSTLFLSLTILAGAFVHATGSGLACPDWPLCLGTLFPEMTGAVLYEHSHRLIAGATGVIVWVTGILYLISNESFSKKIISASLMVLIVIQAIFGGLTVLYQLPGWISTVHFLLAHLTFGGMLYLSWEILESQLTTEHDFTKLDQLLAVGTLFVIFFQMGLGAWLRHIGSKGAPLQSICDGYPFCEANWVEAMTNYYISTYWLHRYSAVLVVCVLGLLLLNELWSRGTGSINFTAIIIAGLTATFQIILGVLTVRASLSVFIVMLHTAGALLLFAVILGINFRTFGLATSTGNDGVRTRE